VRKTRKARGLTVESLHASFERIDKKVHALLAKKATDSDLACCIHKSWKEQFHIPVSDSAVKALIMHYRAVHSPSSGSSKGKRMSRRKQRGGMAPLDYVMGPGLAAQTFGRFPVEMGTTPSVLNGLDLGRFYESNAGRSCDTTGGHNALNQRGGASFWQDLMTPSNISSTVLNGHMPTSVPVNGPQSLVNAIQGGQPLGPYASPVASSVNLSTYMPKPYDPNSIADLSRYASLYRP
jgi:hypothetical protein